MRRTGGFLTEDLSEVDGQGDGVCPRLGFERERGRALGDGRELEEVTRDDELSTPIRHENTVSGQGTRGD